MTARKKHAIAWLVLLSLGYAGGKYDLETMLAAAILNLLQ